MNNVLRLNIAKLVFLALVFAGIFVFNNSIFAQSIISPRQIVTSELLYPENSQITPENEFILEKDVTKETFPAAKSFVSQSIDVTPELLNPQNDTSSEVRHDVDVTLKESIPEGIGPIGIELPLESKLEISGRKGVSLNYGNVVKTNPPAGVIATGGTSAGGITSGFSLTQDLQVRLSGTVGKRVTVNVDYDDTKDQQRDITLLYKGEPDELIQHAQFGDVTLSLPNTEFTGYSKNIFGGDVELKFKNFSLKAIGAQTKGKTKTVSFAGGYSQQKMDITDLAFVKQKYYRIQSTTAIPAHTEYLKPEITPGSEQIWLDDMNGYNNNYPPNYATTGERGTDVTKYTQKTVTGALSLDYLHPGTDYTIDYATGIVTFTKTIQSNFIIVVAYKYNTGGSSFGYDGSGVFDFDDSVTIAPATKYTDANRYIQPALGDATYYDRQLMNYYNLGNKKILFPQYDPEFVFKIYDQNNVEQSLAGFRYNLDVDTGTFFITTSAGSEKPFTAAEPDAYPSAVSATTQSRYRIHVEYKYKFKTYQLPNFSIVKYSESIVMNGVKLNRDLDYTIDYDSGFIFFMNEDKITDKTTIDVTYEYMPFGGGFQSNLFGVRAEYKLDPFAIGSTYLYTGGQTPADVPAAGSTPQSLGILDVDAKLTIPQTAIDSLFGRLFFFPTDISVSGEVARSSFNPNIYLSKNGEPGVAMIDGMESSDNISGLGVDYNTWFTASRPNDVQYTLLNRGSKLNISNYDDYGHDTTSVTKKQLLSVDYSLSAGEWDAIRNVISTTGSDYSKFRYLEIWMKADWTKDVNVEVDLGAINEDINGNILLDTEDINNDGVLNSGEDTGLPVEFAGVASAPGSGNNRLDKEDLDNNAKLDTADNYYLYSFNINNANAQNYVASTVGNWKLIKIPLNFTTPGSIIGTPSASLVKQVRFSLRSSTGAAGNIVVESAQFTGNKWELKDVATIASFDVKAVNQVLDPTYTPLIDNFFLAATTNDLNREQSLSLEYTNTNALPVSPYVFRVLSKAINLMEYKNLRLDIYKKKVSPSDVYFLRIGSDENNYQEYQVKLDELKEGWNTVTIPITDVDVKGPGNGFYLNNVKQISMGVLSSGTANSLWINNLRLTDPDIREGIASRLGGTVKYGDFFSASLDYKKIDSTFNFFEDSSVNSSLSVSQTYASVKQNLMYYSVISNIKPAEFMPVTLSYRRDELLTNISDRTNPNYLSFPERYSDTYGSSLNLSIFNPLNISVNGTYKKEEVQYLPGAVNVDNTSSKGYNVSSRATCNLPTTLFGFIPVGSNNFEGEFRFAEDILDHSLFQDRNTYTLSRETSGKWTGGYEPLAGLNLNPYYQLRQNEKKGNNYAYNSSVSNSIKYLDDFVLQTISRGVGLGVSYSKFPGMSPRINYTAAIDRDYNVNQFRTNNTLELSSDIRLYEWLEFLTSASPSLNISHRISANALYDKYDDPSSTAPIKNLSDIDIWGLVPANNFSFNSSQLITDTASGRFKVATLTFNPRGSLSYEGNRQSQFLTKTNVYSLGSGLNIETPPIPLIGFLNFLSLDAQYDFKNIVRQDATDKIISNSFSHSGNLTLPFRASEAFNGSLSFSTTIEDRFENNVLFMNRTYSPGIDIYQNLNFSDPIKLPDFLFGGAVIRIDQTIRINYKLNLAMTRNTSNSSTVLSNVNTDTYTAGTFIQYSFSKNIRADIGLQFNYFLDNVSNVNNYYAYGVNMKVSAVF